jgi:hypothetical protein
MTDIDEKIPQEKDKVVQHTDNEKITVAESPSPAETLRPDQNVSLSNANSGSAVNISIREKDIAKETLAGLDQLPVERPTVPFGSLDAEIEALLPPDVINMERKVILMILEARMLLRELVEYKLQKDRLRSGNLSPAEIHNLLLLSLNDKDDQDFITDIQELKRRLIKEIRKNRALEIDLDKLEKRIALLIQNRTSIQEIDRELKKMKKAIKKKKQTDEGTEQQKVELDKDKKRLEHYSNLLYLLQTEPNYLAQLLYVMTPEKMKSLLDTLILTLFGDAFSPREEFLILELFRLAIRKEIENIQNITELKEVASVVPSLVIAYNRRKQGMEYLKTVLGPYLNELISADTEYNFEFNPLAIYKRLHKTAEVTPEQAAQDPEVQKTIATNTEQLSALCEKMLTAIFDSIHSLPYGLRLICKQIRNIALERFPKTKQEEIFQVLGYFIYYRFFNTAIVSPNKYNIVSKETLSNQKTLVLISKVLQKVFNLSMFSTRDELVPLNSWIQKTKNQTVAYFTDVIDVPDPEEYLQVTRYMDLTQKTKPIIIITVGEILNTHRLLREYIDQVAPDKDDPLRIVLNDLGEVGDDDEDEEEARKEVQLTLENRFKQNVEEKFKVEENVYETTKELVIQVFKVIPIKPAQNQTLMTVLKDGKDYAKETDNKQLAKNITQILENLKLLEERGQVSKEDRYASFLKDVALEVIHRAERREQQRKEIARLQATLKSVQKHQEYIQSQISEFERYLQKCRENAAKKLKTKKHKQFKFTIKELQKKGVILGTEGDILKAKVFIMMPEMGTFKIEAKVAGVPVAKKELLLEDLLEKKDANQREFELDEHITLNVPMTLLLINKLFLS